MFKIRLEGIEDFERELREVARTISDGVRKGVADGLREGAQEARAVHRWQNRTGAAERATDSRLNVSAPGGAEGELFCEVPYASFLEEGTAAHTISARGEGLLHFFWEKAGDWVLTPSVKHPGTKPSPFMGPALLKCERVVYREIGIAIEKAQKILDR